MLQSLKQKGKKKKKKKERKKERKKRKRKHLCCFGESQKHLLVNKPRAETLGSTLGGKADTFGQISQVEPSKAVSARTRRCGRKDHLETSCDIRLSVNYSNKHAREWHLILDVSPEGTALDASNSNKELRYTNTTENKHSVHCTLSCVRWDTGLLGCKVGQRLIAVFSNVGRRAVIMRSEKTGFYCSACCVLFHRTVSFLWKVDNNGKWLHLFNFLPAQATRSHLAGTSIRKRQTYFKKGTYVENRCTKRTISVFSFMFFFFFLHKWISRPW